MATKSNGKVPAKKRAAGAKVGAKKVVLAKAAIKKAPAKKIISKATRRKLPTQADSKIGNQRASLVPLSYAIGELVVRDGIVGVIDHGQFVSFELHVNRPVCILIAENRQVSSAECITSLRRAIKGIGVNFVSSPPDEVCCSR